MWRAERRGEGREMKNRRRVYSKRVAMNEVDAGRDRATQEGNSLACRLC